MDQPAQQSNSELLERPTAGKQNVFPGEADVLLANVQRLAGIGMLTTGVAQELANLLSVVTTASISLRHELQQQNSPPDDTSQHYLNLIERNAFRSARIISMLQEYGSMESLQMAVSDVDTLLRDTLMLVERQFREQSNIRVEVNTPGETQSIVCDHNRVVQLLVNLLIDARDSMQDSGGLIEVMVQVNYKGESDPLHDIGGRKVSDQDCVAITISDEGPGIPAGDQEQMFTPFFSTRSDGNAIGLGLSVAHEIVRQHNGDIWYSKNKGPEKGASVTVVLPLRPST